VHALNLPRSWQLSTIGEEFSIQLGKMLDAARNAGETKPYIGNSAVRWGYVDVSKAGSVPLTPADIKRYRLKPGDLLVCEGGEVGRAAIWRGELPECYYQKALHRLRSKRGFDPRLLMYLLQLWSRRGELANYVTQTSIAHLPKDKLAIVPLPKPPSRDQAEIVQVLAGVDELIDSLERIIAKKRDIKRGVLQSLITGKTRLPGFHEDWERATFGEIASLSKDRIDPRLRSTQTPVVELEHIEPGMGTVLRFGSAANAQSLKAVFRPGDVLFGRLRAYLRKYWLADRGGLCSTEVWVIRPKSERSIGAYVRCVVESEAFIRAAGTAYGTHMPRSDWGAVRRLAFDVPPLEEQQVIAKALSALDAEIQALGARLAKTHDIKQGMLQGLLTGRIRLAEEAVAA
jgi:type I restriction enzyme S subunit